MTEDDMPEPMRDVTPPSRPTRRARRRIAVLVLAVCALPAAVACSGSSTTSSTSAAPTSAASTGDGPTTVAAKTSYATIADLQKALESKSITCKLEYPGLKDDTQNKELSICTIDGEQAFLTIWLDPKQLQAFVSSPDGQSGIVAVGENWTVTVSTSAAATKIATALGGTVPGSAP